MEKVGVGECVLLCCGGRVTRWLVAKAESRARLLESWPYHSLRGKWQVSNQSAPQFPYLKSGGDNIAYLHIAVRRN